MDRYSILIVDDDETDRYILKRLLKSCGIDVPIFEKCDGVEAIEFLQNYEAGDSIEEQPFPPTIVFLDINMPRMNGFGFLEEFARMDASAHRLESIVFVMISSSDNLEDKQRAQQFPFVKDYIVKMPSSGAELLAFIQKHLPDRRVS